MAIGSATDGDSTAFERLPSPRAAGRAILSALVYSPGRSTAMLLVAVPYLWLAYYIPATALGLQGDPIIGGDWLTLVFTTYALLAPLGVAHRILKIGLTELTEEYLLDVVVLTWLTAFYFVWMMAREPVSPSTTAADLYGPVVAGEPQAVGWVVLVAVVAVVVAGLTHWPRPDSRLFGGEFRTALVTMPAVVTAVVLLASPGPASLVWPFVGGAFIGTFLGGLTRIHWVASSIARGLFAVASLVVWSVGAVGWLLAYHRLPPKDHIVLSHVQFGHGTSEEDRTTTHEET